MVVPPDAVTVAVPFELPQVELVVEVESERAAGCETTADAVAVQPLESVTVTLYVAAQSDVKSSVVDALLHE